MALTPERRLEVLRGLMAEVEAGDESSWDAWERTEALSDAIKALEREQRDATPIGEAALRAYYLLCEHFTDNQGAQGHDGHWTDETAQEVALEIDRALFSPGALKARTDTERALQERVEALEEVLRVELCRIGVMDQGLQDAGVDPYIVGERTARDCLLEMRRGLDTALHPHASHCNDSEHEGACPPGEREP